MDNEDPILLKTIGFLMLQLTEQESTTTARALLLALKGKADHIILPKLVAFYEKLGKDVPSWLPTSVLKLLVEFQAPNEYESQTDILQQILEEIRELRIIEMTRLGMEREGEEISEYEKDFKAPNPALEAAVKRINKNFIDKQEKKGSI